MEKYLCVIRQDDSVDWYLLCVRDTMFCLSSGPKKSIITSIRNIKKRYHTVYGLSEALHDMSEPCKPNPITYSAYHSLYKSQKGKYDYILCDTLDEEYEKIREKRKPKKPVLVKKTKEVEAPKKKGVLSLPKKKTTNVKKGIKPLKAKVR